MDTSVQGLTVTGDRQAMRAARASIAASRLALDEADRLLAAELGEAVDIAPADREIMDLSAPKWLTPQQAAGAVNVHISTLRRLIVAHDDIAKRVGGRLLVDRDALRRIRSS